MEGIMGNRDFFRLIEQRLLMESTIRDNMLAVIDLCAEKLPHPDWEQFRQISFDEEGELLEWLETVFREEPPETTIEGLWFVIFEATYKGKKFADMYISGTEEFCDDEGDMDWACDPVYMPEACNADSQVLADLYQIAYRDKLGLCNDALYALGLAYGAFAVKHILSKIDPAMILNGAKSVGVAVGFDGGDYVRVGFLTVKGLRIRTTKS